MIIKTLFNALPHQCPSCEQTTQPNQLCLTCQGFLDVIQTPCPGCGKGTSHGSLCGSCLKRRAPWQHLLVAWRFTGLIRFLVHQFKYQRDVATGRALIALWLTQVAIVDKPTALVAVPMHYRKHHRKGFNQADWLTKELSKKLDIPVWHGVARQLETQPLEGLNRSERQKALRGAFTVTRPPPSHVAIVDDVFTSGATLSEMSKVLKQAGCKRIDCWVLARTPLGKH